MIDLGDYEIECLELAFPGHPVHIWIYERTRGTLFTVDWLERIHLEAYKYTFGNEVDGGASVQQVVDFTSQALFWHRYVDP